MARYTTFRRAAALGLLLTAAGAGPAGADTIDHGPAAQGTLCSDLETVDSSCLLPFGPPASAPTAVTSVALGAIDPSDLLVAAPTDGGWTTRPAAAGSARWKVRGGAGTTDMVADTAIALAAGEQLVILDPMVRDGASTDFELPESGPFDGSRLVAGLPVPVEAAGTITTEPDADADGYGDVTADLCPGVAAAICAPGAPRLEMTNPGYVPALEPVAVSWTVRNAGSAPQPFFINWSSRTRIDQFAGPPGTTCAPGHTSVPVDRFVAPPLRSPLLSDPSFSAIAWTVLYPAFGAVPPEVSTTCRLPVLAPGATATGTVGGTGWSTDKREGDGIRFEVVAPSRAYPLVGSDRVSMRIVHPDDTKPRAALAPKGVRAARAAGRPGRLALFVTAAAPQPGKTPAITGELRTVVGGKVLARLTTPVSVAASAPSLVRFTFTRSGLRWLAKHPRTTKLLAVMTARNTGELPSTSTTRISFTRSASLRRQLAKLARRR